MARQKATPVLAAPVVEPRAYEPEETIVTNCLAGTRLALGDGRTLEYGESAIVSPVLAAFLIERGQAE